MFAKGDFGMFFTRPIAVAFFIAAAVSLTLGIVKSVRPKKQTEAEKLAAEADL